MGAFRLASLAKEFGFSKKSNSRCMATSRIGNDRDYNLWKLNQQK